MSVNGGADSQPARHWLVQIGNATGQGIQRVPPRCLHASRQAGQSTGIFRATGNCVIVNPAIRSHRVIP